MGMVTEEYAPKRLYGVKKGEGGRCICQLSDKEVSLPGSVYEKYNQLVERMAKSSNDENDANFAQSNIINAFLKAGLIYKKKDIPEIMSGAEFHEKYFSPLLEVWLHKAFSHPFWELMMEGKGSARMYAGWLFELYHYTKNANRHMPLATACCHQKRIKTLFAKHFEEEWNHYHFFSRALRAMGYSKEQIETSRPLTMTMEMSNFMRQAARRDSLAYSICSAVLEGTTVDRGSYNPFYESVQELYDVPVEAVKPIYDHLDLDIQYQHSDLFLDICKTVDEIDDERASLVLSYGHQMIEHIWMWTENIWSYYSNKNNPVPARTFDYYRD